MPRKPRLHLPGALYHVILRGNAKEDIFFDAEDRRRFLLFLQESVERFGFRLHGYCLMTNHVHLAIQVGEVPLSRIMQNLSLRYSKWINWRKERIGHLFHGRFKAVMVEADNYLTQLVAYLHLNPVRAQIAQKPEEYPWSSHQAYLGLCHTPWLTTELVLSLFSNRESKAREAFRQFVAGRCYESHRPEFHGMNSIDSRVFGDDPFSQEVLEKESEKKVMLTIEDILAAAQESCGVTSDELLSPGQGFKISEARALAAWGVLSTNSGTLKELGKKLGRDMTSLSSAAKRLSERARKDNSVAAKMAAMKMAMDNFATLQA
jgi:putative transposase